MRAPIRRGAFHARETPSQIQVGTLTHRMRVRAWKLEAIVHCNLKEGKGRLREADCAVEDAALRVHRKKPTRRDERALLEMAQSLKGASLSMQVNSKGRVPNVGIDGMNIDSYDERQVADGARVMLKQLAAAFHMSVPEEHPIGAEWHAMGDPLAEVAAPIAGLGSMNVVHRIDILKGHWVQQTIGEGVVTTRARNPTAGTPCFRDDGNPRCPKMPIYNVGVSAPPPSMFEAPDGMGVPLTPEEPDTLDLELRFTNSLQAVSIIDPDKGYPVERVWTVTGEPSASSMGNGYWAAGNLRLLAPLETAAIGFTGAVSAPGEDSGKVPRWVSVAQ